MRSMKTITFYSYKGGVGRTLAAVNFAVYLARLGLNTVLIDFDLEAPGIDAKFANLNIPDQQKGILDYILVFQEKNVDPGSIKQISLPINFSSSVAAPLWLIPAGQYLSEDYSKKLSRLNWNKIFSPERNGVAFFQQFLKRIEAELKADYVIIDSRTGISEIAGLCTQQLANEVVMFSSLSSESIKVTKHIKKLIETSKIAKSLNKLINAKVVVSRVPKPDNLITLKEECVEKFDVSEENLFLLFSNPSLEINEFIAMIEPQGNDTMIASYVELFYGLNLELATENVRAEIAKAQSTLLSSPAEQAEQKISELVTLYPHPEAYRSAMRFYQLSKEPQKARDYAWKLLGAISGDVEASNMLAKSYLAAA
jgi:MinD-like ATPase involved in chromosome partitioning or flagellar assembly